MTYRMLLALLALVDALVAYYLHLWKTGRAGTLACGAGHGCEVAQFSSYGWFLGHDVALIGAVGWGVVFLVAVAGTLRAYEDARWPAALLTGLVAFAVLFTARLKYGEFVVLRTFCPWCAVNVAVTLAAVVLLAREWARLGRLRAGDRGAHATAAASTV